MSIALCMKRDDARRYVLNAQREGRSIGLVPTMGALHQGHLSLMKASAAECDCTIVTVFVNPTQFGPQEDFEKYPPDLGQDLAKVEGLGVDMVLAPAADEGAGQCQ